MIAVISDTIWIAIIAAIGTMINTMLYAFTHRNIKELEKNTNNKMDILLALTAKESKSAGVAEEKARQVAASTQSKVDFEAGAESTKP